MAAPVDLESSYILIPSSSVEEDKRKHEENIMDSVIEKKKAKTPAGPITSYAHDWSNAATGGLRRYGRHFVDAQGRVCNLRGVNLGGSSKSPANHDDDTFPANHADVTFVGRPFPLDEAHEHFSRLRRWGMSFIRFLVTWEALEHAGPGQYDTEYILYLRNLLSLLPKYGMTAFVSLHQDVWSRYTGGSGAPAWTLEAVGFDLHALEQTGAAWLLGVKGGGHTEEERGIWPTGYQKLAASTMATCFWAGDAFAPKLKIKSTGGKEVPVQEFLQDHFLNALKVLTEAVSDLEGILGFEVMNEPHPGYINLKSLHSFDYNTDLHLSAIPSAFQSFMLGAGHPTYVSNWTRSFPMPTSRKGEVLLNEQGHKVWRPDGPTGGQCLWEMHGVWGFDIKKKEGVVLRESYFLKHPATGNKVDWYDDCYYPFLRRWADVVRSASPADKLLFVEAIPNEFCPPSWTPENQVPNMVYAPHWYDLNGLFMKAWGDFSVNVQGLSRGMFLLKAFYWGHVGARNNFSLQIRNIVEAAYRVLGEMPVVIGECGIPMDMNLKQAFTDDLWTWQVRMMDAMITGLERSLVGFTLWNYNPYNSDEKGDHWNGENFSWFSRSRALPPDFLTYDQISPTLDQGGRILESVVRPYAAKTAGIPLSCEYEMTTGRFAYQWVTPDSSANASAAVETKSVSHPPLSETPTPSTNETLIFMPHLLTAGRNLKLEGLGSGDKWVHDESVQTIFVRTADSRPGQLHQVVVTVDPPLNPAFELNDFWSDFGGRILAFIAALFAIIAYYVLA